ncbi:hypothetical protein C5E19_11285 [Pectobacterium parmentieri]|nr:hypothetical protein C5E26_11850 [Pectobacterium parmentieri]AYH27848.1 hypothetical protein C5E20_12255 [Pectobacterium parmentieri]AYH32154.1 hypothetical protein C5E19_11285 [Pectobacterium parmentieri]
MFAGYLLHIHIIYKDKCVDLFDLHAGAINSFFEKTMLRGILMSTLCDLYYRILFIPPLDILQGIRIAKITVSGKQR